MDNKQITITKQLTREAMIKIPLSALRCILRYPKEKKIICEINIKDIKRLNKAETFDEIINEARLDYGLGKFTAHTTLNSLLNELHS